MRVACISKTFPNREAYGFGRYAWTMMEYLRANSTIETIACSLVRKSMPHSLENLHHSPYLGRYTETVWRTLNFPPLEWWTPSFDVVHSFEPTFPVITKKPWVATVHDIIPLTHPHFFENVMPPHFGSTIEFILQNATKMIFISQTAADSVQEFYPKVNITDRFEVIPLGVNKFFLAEPDEAEADRASTNLSFDAPYIMLAGVAVPRKNLMRAVEAFDLVAADIPHHLVMTGRLGWDSEVLLERIKRSPYQDRIHRVGEVSIDELRNLYRHAAINLYISLVEGFGLPIVEAMACGCPVVTSNISSMPEVAGEAACLVDPYDVPSIAEGILKVANDPAYRDELIVKGKARAQEMSWQRCIEETINVYRQVAK